MQQFFSAVQFTAKRQYFIIKSRAKGCACLWRRNYEEADRKAAETMEKKYTWVDVFKIAVPIFVEQILRSLMGTVNTFMLSRVSDSASAAVGVASQVLNVVIIASFMMSSGTAIIENQLLGAGKNREAGKGFPVSVCAEIR